MIATCRPPPLAVCRSVGPFKHTRAVTLGLHGLEQLFRGDLARCLGFGVRVFIRYSGLDSRQSIQRPFDGARAVWSQVMPVMRSPSVVMADASKVFVPCFMGYFAFTVEG